MSQEKIAAALEEMLTEMQGRENTGYMSEAISSVATELRTRLAALRAQAPALPDEPHQHLCECKAIGETLDPITYWVIERGSPAEYWVRGGGPGHHGKGTVWGEWTKDVMEAQHFTEDGAKLHAQELEQWGIKGELRACAHVNSPGPTHADVDAFRAEVDAGLAKKAMSQEGETPRTRAIMAFVGQLHSASGETYYALKEGAECGIASLERELNFARKEADRLTALVIERDKDRARLTAECDEITALNHAQWLSLENVRMLAGRFRKEEWAQHALRFCEEAGNASRILRAAKPAAVPEGWRLVPVEPTATMKQVGDDAWRWSKGGTGVLPAYRAMLAAAPEAPAVVCSVCSETEPFTGTCGGGRNNPKALCYVHLSPTPHAAPAAAEAATAWQPIDTAPKTKHLLLGFMNAGGKWRTVRGRWFSRDEIDTLWEEAEGCEEGWYEESFISDDIPNCWIFEPTHWHPLPTPPKE